MAQRPNPQPQKATVIDLFSGAGGMSCGFHAHPRFEVVAAVDFEVGKPSSGIGSLGCNATYQRNIGIEPLNADLSTLSPKALAEAVAPGLKGRPLDVLIACAPCTGFTRTNASNHIVDDPRNSLVTRTALYAKVLEPSIFLMENARELLSGVFTHHFERLRRSLEQLGYEVDGSIHVLSEFGLPQKRERALIVAVKRSLPLFTLKDLWDGYRVRPEATHVRRAIGHLPPITAGEAHPSDSMHVSPRFSERGLRRLQLTPPDGGSWADLRHNEEAAELLTPAMQRTIAKGKFGSHPDVYGRMWWDRPSVTIKRECGHTGNGRYAHPDQDRLCTVREMAILQGFPQRYRFLSNALTNMYRHIGDAVPPLIAYQLACLCDWMLGGQRPDIRSVILPRTHLRRADIEPSPHHQLDLLRSVIRAATSLG